jgi:hypothetical protein
MNYKKIREQLKKQNLIDDNNLICHSHRSYTATKDRVIFMELTRIGNEKNDCFYIILNMHKDDTKKLVEYIIKYNKKSSLN